MDNQNTESRLTFLIYGKNHMYWDRRHKISSETENLMANTPSRMSDREAEISWSISVTSGEVARQMRAVTDPVTQQLGHLCELMRELKNE